MLGLNSSFAESTEEIPQEIKQEIFNISTESVDLHVIRDQYDKHLLSAYHILTNVRESTREGLFNHSYVRLFNSRRYMGSLNFPDMVAIDRLAEHFLGTIPIGINPGIALTKSLLPQSRSSRSFFPPRGVDSEYGSSVIKTDHGYVHVIYQFIDEFTMKCAISYKSDSRRSRFPSTNLEFMHEFKS